MILNGSVPDVTRTEHLAHSAESNEEVALIEQTPGVIRVCKISFSCESQQCFPCNGFTLRVASESRVLSVTN